MTRAIRLKRPDDALYWVKRLTNDGATAVSVCRLLLKSALHDNLNIDLMVRATELTTVHPGWNPLAEMLALELASSEKLWSVHEGRQLIQVVYALQSDCSLRDFSNDELLLQLEQAMNDEFRLADALTAVREIWKRCDAKPESPQSRDRMERLIEMLVRAGSSSIAKPVDIFAAHPTEPLIYLIVTWLVTGPWGQATEDILVSPRVGNEPIPDWAKPEDRRFDETWDGYANMALMFEEHGRVDPDDDGIIFKTKGGQWKPLIREEAGLYLVQSEENPKWFYEVNLAILSCTCQHFLKRQRPCKHVEAARRHVESRLPFTVRST